MRITLNIDDELLERAKTITGIKEKNALLQAGLEALVMREAGKRLAVISGTEPHLSNTPRRRPN